MLIARQMPSVTDLQALLIAQHQQVAAINNTSTDGLHQAEVLDVNLLVTSNTVSCRSCLSFGGLLWSESQLQGTHCCPHTLLASML